MSQGSLTNEVTPGILTAAQAFGLDVSSLVDAVDGGLLAERSKRLIFAAKRSMGENNNNASSTDTDSKTGEAKTDCSSTAFFLLKEIGPGQSEVDANVACAGINRLATFAPQPSSARTHSSSSGMTAVTTPPVAVEDPRLKSYNPPTGGGLDYVVQFQTFLPVVTSSSSDRRSVGEDPRYVHREELPPGSDKWCTARLWVCTPYIPRSKDLRHEGDEQLVRKSLAAVLGCMHEATSERPSEGVRGKGVYLEPVTSNLEENDRCGSDELVDELQALEAQLSGLTFSTAPPLTSTPAPVGEATATTATPDTSATIVEDGTTSQFQTTFFPLPTYPDHGPSYLDKDEAGRFVWTGSAFGRCRFVLDRLFGSPTVAEDCFSDEAERSTFKDYFTMILFRFAGPLNALPLYVTSGDTQRKNVLMTTSASNVSPAAPQDDTSARGEPSAVVQLAGVNLEKTTVMPRVWELVWLVLLDDNASGVPDPSQLPIASPEEEEENQIDQNVLVLNRIKSALVVYCRSCLSHPLTTAEIALFPIALQLKCALIATILPKYRRDMIRALRWAMDHEHPLRMVATEVQTETVTWKKILRKAALEA